MLEAIEVVLSINVVVSMFIVILIEIVRTLLF